MAPLDMIKVTKQYTGLWVAFDKNSKPIAAGQTIEEAMKKARGKGNFNPILTKIPSENFGYIL
ncbi:MAG: DUF5678 domain-containing protein [Candidatus Paceibacterota bacterium]|jgi:hypothetical protein